MQELNVGHLGNKRKMQIQSNRRRNEKSGLGTGKHLLQTFLFFANTRIVLFALYLY